MSKFQRTYKMEVTGRSGQKHTISYPLTLMLNTSRRDFDTVNSGHFTVYNLSPDVRDDIRFDPAIDSFKKNPKLFLGLPFQLSAGYISEGYLGVIFKGRTKRAFSYRENGSGDVITEIEVWDGGTAMQYAQIERTRATPWTAVDEMKELIRLLGPYGVSFGAVGSLFANHKPLRGVTWVGSVWDNIKNFARHNNGYACIDLERVLLLAENDFLVDPGMIPELNSSTGLIGTPRRTGHVVDAEMLFEPGITLTQKLKVSSDFNPTVNGTFKVKAISHRGTISGAKDGGVITALSLFDGIEAMNPISSQ